MKKQFVRNNCPVCGQSYTRETPTRKVHMNRDLVDDEGVSVMAAKCLRCKTEYEFYGPKSVPVNIGGPRLLALLMITLLLSILGGMVGIIMAAQGGHELNPILAYYLDLGPVYYFLVKYFLTVSGLLLLVLLRKRFEAVSESRTEQILLGVQVLFAVTLIYDLIFFGTGGKVLLLTMGMWVGCIFYLKPEGLDPLLNRLSIASNHLFRRLRSA